MYIAYIHLLFIAPTCCDCPCADNQFVMMQAAVLEHLAAELAGNAARDSTNSAPPHSVSCVH